MRLSPSRFFLGEQALLESFLATYTVRCPRDCVEPFDLNLLAAVDALTKGAFSDSVQRIVDQLEGIALVGAL